MTGAISRGSNFALVVCFRCRRGTERVSCLSGSRQVANEFCFLPSLCSRRHSFLSGNAESLLSTLRYDAIRSIASCSAQREAYSQVKFLSWGSNPDSYFEVCGQENHHGMSCDSGDRPVVCGFVCAPGSQCRKPRSISKDATRNRRNWSSESRILPHGALNLPNDMW